ncbi:hypothetical protein EJB05_28624, partial [Eragrostis curvula]
MPDRSEKDGTPAAATGASEDRLSALPDDLLHLILSPLPSDQAVRTCVLACRWRHIWKSARAIRIKSRPWRAEKLHSFVNHLLLLRGGTPADVCFLTAGELLEDRGYNEQHYQYQKDHLHGQLCKFAQLWIRHVLTVCRVRVLKVWVRTYRRLSLDKTPLASPVLMRLNLRDVSFMFDFWQHQDQRSFRPLDFSNCPALKELTMTFCKIHVSAIVSNTLKWLTIKECHFHSKFRTRVSTPLVEWMELSVCYGRAPILDNMPKLEAADVRLENDYYDCCENDDYYGDCKDDECRGCLGSSDTSSVLLASLSGATDLALMSDPRQYIFPRDCKSCIIFDKLETLVLNDWCMGAGFGGLVFFLRYSPVLKKLTLQLEYCEKEQAVVVTDDQYIPTEHFLSVTRIRVQITTGRWWIEYLLIAQDIATTGLSFHDGGILHHVCFLV